MCKSLAELVNSLSSFASEKVTFKLQENGATPLLTHNVLIFNLFYDATSTAVVRLLPFFPVLIHGHDTQHSTLLNVYA
jgi:hypothetical protein